MDAHEFAVWLECSFSVPMESARLKRYDIYTDADCHDDPFITITARSADQCFEHIQNDPFLSLIINLYVQERAE